MESFDRALSWIGALSVPAMTILGYFKRRSIHYRVDQLEKKIDKRFNDLQLAIIQSK